MFVDSGLKDKTILLKSKIKERLEEIQERQPHEFEYESGAETLEEGLLNTIDYHLLNDEIQEIEGATLGETIYALRSVLTTLETFGENNSQRDVSSAETLAQDLIDFGFKVEIEAKEFSDNEDEVVVEDYYDYLNVTTSKGNNIRIKVLSFFYMYASEIDGFLYQFTFTDDTYGVSIKTNSFKKLLKELMKF